MKPEIQVYLPPTTTVLWTGGIFHVNTADGQKGAGGGFGKHSACSENTPFHMFDGVPNLR